jgi:hypothetical protein
MCYPALYLHILAAAVGVVVVRPAAPRNLLRFLAADNPPVRSVALLQRLSIALYVYKTAVKSRCSRRIGPCVIVPSVCWRRYLRILIESRGECNMHKKSQRLQSRVTNVTQWYSSVVKHEKDKHAQHAVPCLAGPRLRLKPPIIGSESGMASQPHSPTVHRSLDRFPSVSPHVSWTTSFIESCACRRITIPQR